MLLVLRSFIWVVNKNICMGEKVASEINWEFTIRLSLGGEMQHSSQVTDSEKAPYPVSMEKKPNKIIEILCGKYLNDKSKPLFIFSLLTRVPREKLYDGDDSQ